VHGRRRGFARDQEACIDHRKAIRPPAEEGEIVVRAHVTAAGCASEFAVVVSSGYPDLDQGAVQLAEASRYAAAKDGEKPADGFVTFKVRFEISE
jgi:TonB family protein